MICLSHIGASALMGTHAARLLSIDPKLAPFYKPKTEGGYEPARRSISAILLAAVHEKQLEVVGLLHPDPVRPLDIEIFDDVPFFRVKWPITGKDVEGEWITAHPSPLKDLYVSVELTANEKKSLK